MPQVRRFLSQLLLLLSFLFVSSCGDEENITTFHGTVTRASDNKPANGVVLIFVGLHSSGGLWPSVEEVSEHIVIVNQSGEFSITISENPQIHRFKVKVQTSAGDYVGINSGCPDLFCEHLDYGKTTELTFEVDL